MRQKGILAAMLLFLVSPVGGCCGDKGATTATDPAADGDQTPTEEKTPAIPPQPWLWVDRGGEPQDGTMSLLHGDLRYTAVFSPNASGCTVEAVREDTGEPAWTTPLQGLGPIGHSRYANDVQMAVLDGRLVVHGNEASGKYIEVLDLATGESLSNTRPDDKLTSIPWSWPRGDEPRPRLATVAIPGAAGGIFRFTHEEDPDRDTVQQLNTTSDVLWSTPLEPRFVADASLLHRNDTLFVAHYCAIASGIRLIGLDANSGVERYSVQPLGLGPIGHSKYSNEVELRWMHEHLVIFGRESQGRYVEVIDPEDGETVSCLRMPN